MCLIINSAIHKRRFGKYIPIKTRKNLEVYKFVKVDWHEKNPQMINSAVQDYTYLIDNIYNTKFSIEGVYNNEVHNGYHSYIHRAIAESHLSYYSKIFGSNGLAVCIIPKGSKIYLGTDEEVVSNKIKIVKVEKL